MPNCPHLKQQQQEEEDLPRPPVQIPRPPVEIQRRPRQPILESDEECEELVMREPVMRELVMREPVIREPVMREPVMREPVMRELVARNRGQEEEEQENRDDDEDDDLEERVVVRPQTRIRPQPHTDERLWIRLRQSASYDLRAMISHEPEADSLEVAESDKGIHTLNPVSNPPSVNSHPIIAAESDKGAPTTNAPPANSPAINPHKPCGFVGNELPAKSDSLVRMIMNGPNIPEF